MDNKKLKTLQAKFAQLSVQIETITNNEANLKNILMEKENILLNQINILQAELSGLTQEKLLLSQENREYLEKLNTEYRVIESILLSNKSEKRIAGEFSEIKKLLLQEDLNEKVNEIIKEERGCLTSACRTCITKGCLTCTTCTTCITSSGLKPPILCSNFQTTKITCRPVGDTFVDKLEPLDKIEVKWNDQK